MYKTEGNQKVHTIEIDVMVVYSIVFPLFDKNIGFLAQYCFPQELNYSHEWIFKGQIDKKMKKQKI